MNKTLALFILVFCSITNAKSNDLSDLEYNDIDPTGSYHYDNHEKEHDKRTVFHSSHRNYGLAKHVGVHPAGFKYVLGYSGVDLRYVPVIRPVSYRSPHHHYHRLKLKRPLLLRPLLTARPHYHHAHHTKPILDSSHGHGYWKPEGIKPEHHVVHDYHPPAAVIHDHHPHQGVIHNHHPHQEVIHDHHPHQTVEHDHHPHQTIIHDHHAHHGVLHDHHPLQTVIHDHHSHHGVLHDHHPLQTVIHDHHSHHGVIHDHHPNHAVIHDHHSHIIPEVHPSPFLLHHQVVPQPAPAVQVRPVIPAVQFPVSFPAHLHPVAPAPALAPAPAPAPAPHLFEVTKPNLPVLPLGASFPSSILQQAFQQAAAVSPGYHFHNIKTLLPSPVFPQAVLRHPIPVPQPVVPQQVIPQPVFPPQPQVVVPRPAQPSNVYPPGTIVEYHGTRHFVPVNGRIPILPQGNVFHQHPAVNTAPQETPFRPILPPQEHHGVQTPLLPANHPNFIHDHLPPGFFSQQLPDVTHQQPPLRQVNDQEFHHQVLNQHHQVLSQHPSLHQYSQQIPSEDHNQNEGFHNIGHQDLPNENTGNQQPTALFTEQFPVENSHSHGNEGHNKVIQPGQTDLQLPLHLPAHPNYFPSNSPFTGGNFHDPQQHPEKVLRPNSSLEPPYN